MTLVPQIPEGLSARAYLASLLGPVALAAALGVQVTLTAALLVKPPVRRTAGYTIVGAWLYVPERDLLWYLAGIGLAMGAALTFTLVWRRRLGPAGSPVPDRRLLRRSLLQAVVAIAATVLYLNGYVHARTQLILQGRVPGSFQVFAIAIAAAIVAVALISRKRRNEPAAEPRPNSFLDRLGPFEMGRARLSVLDLVVPIVIVLFTYVPFWRQTAGRAFQDETMFHWDFFAMGPMLGLDSGAALGTDVHSLYGVGWPMFYRALSGWLPISYGRMIQIGSIYLCIYMLGVYLLLRMLVRRPLLAALGAALLILQFSVATQEFFLWRFPSLTFMRWPFDVWCFIALVMHWRSGRRIWAIVAGAMVGLAIVFVVDTGVYLAAAVGLYWLGTVAIASDKGRRLLDSVLSGATALIVLAAGFLIASRGTFLQAGFWKGLFETFLQFGDGYGMLPLATYPRTPALAFFAVVFLFHLVVLGWSLVLLLHGRAGHFEIFNGCLSVYGLLLQTKFVGYSENINAFRLWVPALLVAINLAGRADFHIGKYLRSLWGESLRTRAAVSMPYVAVGLVVSLLVAAAPGQPLTDQLLSYPSLVSAAVRGHRPDGLCLMTAPTDICGIPPELAGTVEQSRAFAARLSTLGRQGKKIAILDTSGLVFHVASDTAPWGRYARLFDTVIDIEQVDRVVAMLEEHPPELVLTRLPPRPGYENWAWFGLGPIPGEIYADTLERLLEVVRRDYLPDSEAGPYQVWTRRAPGGAEVSTIPEIPVVVGR